MKRVIPSGLNQGQRYMPWLPGDGALHGWSFDAEFTVSTASEYWSFEPHFDGTSSNIVAAGSNTGAVYVRRVGQ
jgi:hypothetical protein